MDPAGNFDYPDFYFELCQLISGGETAAGTEGFSPEDWRKIAELAQSEGVAGLLHWVISREQAPFDVLDDVRTGLAQSYYADAAQNALLLDELDQVLVALSRAGVPVIVLKGAALGRELYPDPALRPMNDLDLLVQPSKLRIAMKALEKCGYQVLKSTYHVVLQGGPRQSVTIELHWNLIAASSDRMEKYLDGVWKRALPLKADDSPVFRMHPADCLLYLCAHLIWQHSQERPRLLWFYDLYLLLQRYGQQMDWGELADLAIESGWGQPLYQALLGVEQRFGTQHPAGFIDELAHQAPVVRRLPGKGQTTNQRMQRWLWDSTGGLPWGLRLQMWMGLLLPDPAYMRWRYRPRADWLLLVYYPLRWWMLIKDGLVNRIK